MSQEREILIKVFHHLGEINLRRISAMKPINDLPEIEVKVQQGQILLTHLGLAHSLFQKEKILHQQELSREEKLSVFEKIANKPVREAERIMLSLSSAPELAKPDRIHAISEDKIEMKFVASVKLLQELEKLKGILAHRFPALSLGELFEMLCDLGLKEWGLAEPAAPRKQFAAKRFSKIQVKRDALSRAGSQCQNCGSYYALELDHIWPRAKGGSSRPENLRILCHACNQRAVIEAFGMRKMDDYLNRGGAGYG